MFGEGLKQVFAFGRVLCVYYLLALRFAAQFIELSDSAGLCSAQKLLLAQLSSLFAKASALAELDQ